MVNNCSNCGAENAAGARFCNQCGNTLAVAGAAAERRQITVLFSDLSGFTAISERLDPEDVQAITNRIFAAATEIVEKYGGRIDKFQGDAVMAVFGDPVAHEDDAERAVRAVIDLHDAVDQISPEVEPKIGRPITMHSGINSGLVVTGGVEFDNAVGDAINVAARLESLSQPGEILLGPETASLVAGIFDTDDHGSHELKGKSGPVPVTRVLGLAATRLEPSRRQAEFVGRHEELGILLSAVERMRDGESSVVTVQAEAGAGKTRLFAEFQKRLPEEVQWLEGRAYAYGENIPYASLIDLLGRAVGIHEDDAGEAVEEKLRLAVADLVDDVDTVYAPLARLFGLAIPEGIALDRETFQARLLDSVLEMTDALAARAPTVLTFQDLHWADASTIELIRELIGRMQTPVVVVANYRPQFSLDVPDARQLQLGELSARQTGELLASLLDGEAPPTEFIDFIVERTDGNPFFVEEIVNSLVETETLQRNDHGWEVKSDLSQIELPTSIRGVIAARIDRLDDRRRRVLREASVVGREFLYDIVRQVSTETDDLMPSLNALEAADLIREKAIDPDLEYLFKHALTQDVAYDGLLKSEREELHARAAAAIETQFRGRAEEVTETLAYHWLLSGITDKAVPSLMAAGRKAMERFALKESQAHYRQAYELLEKEPHSELRDRQIVELLLEWAFLAYYQARLYDLKELLMEHQEAVDRVGSPEEEGMWMAWIGHARMTGDGEYRKALATLDRALDMGRQAKNPRVIGYAQSWRVYAFWWLGRNREAIEAGTEAYQIELPDDPYVWFKSKCGVALALMTSGEFVKARSIGDELIAFGERTGSARAKSMGHLVLLNLNGYSLDLAEVVAHYEAIRASGDDPIYEHAGGGGQYLGSLIAAGKTKEAREVHDEQLGRYATDLHVRLMVEFLHLSRGLIEILEGHLTEGFATIEQVIHGAEISGEGLYEKLAKILLAMSYANVVMADSGLGDLLRNPVFVARYGLRAKKEAFARLDDLLAHLGEWDAAGYRFSIELTYARLLAHQGDSESAVRHLRAGMDGIEPMGDTVGFRMAQQFLTELEG